MPSQPHRRFAIAAFALALSALALTACAGNDSRSQKIAEKARQRFADADANHDGSLDRDEAAKGMPRIAAHFDEIDANHDGLLSTAEIMSYIQQRRSAH